MINIFNGGEKKKQQKTCKETNDTKLGLVYIVLRK